MDVNLPFDDLLPVSTEFEAVLDQSPDNESVRLAYAEWLDERENYLLAEIMRRIVAKSIVPGKLPKGYFRELGGDNGWVDVDGWTIKAEGTGLTCFGRTRHEVECTFAFFSGWLTITRAWLSM